MCPRKGHECKQHLEGELDDIKEIADMISVDATILCVCGMLGLVDPLECDIDKRESQFNAC